MTTKILGQTLSDHFAFYWGDNIEVIAGIPDDSIGLTVSSPPFSSMYTFSVSPRDMGNTKSTDEMMEHYRYLVRDMLRVTMPGRSNCVHLTQTNAFMHREGYVGRFDFRGDVIRLHQSEGWIYAGEVTIGKDPQMRRARTNDRGLLFKSLVNDSSVLVPACADYLLIFRKSGDNPEPIRAGISERYNQHDGWITEEEWIEWANAVWPNYSLRTPWGIRETNVLNAALGRCEEDERHLCPLQLDVIERAIKLWSAPGDTVFDPFGGIGSTPYQAIKLNRKGVAAELKRSYYEQAVRNCKRAEAERPQQRTLFDLMAEGVDTVHTEAMEAVACDDGSRRSSRVLVVPEEDDE